MSRKISTKIETKYENQLLISLFENNDVSLRISERMRGEFFLDKEITGDIFDKVVKDYRSKFLPPLKEYLQRKDLPKEYKSTLREIAKHTKPLTSVKKADYYIDTVYKQCQAQRLKEHIIDNSQALKQDKINIDDIMAWNRKFFVRTDNDQFNKWYETPSTIPEKKRKQ